MKAFIIALPFGILVTIAVMAALNYGSIATVAKGF